MNKSQKVVFGPAYLDIVVVIDQPLVTAFADITLDQSLPASRSEGRDDGQLMLIGNNGDALSLQLPPQCSSFASTYYLSEPVLARHWGTQATEIVSGNYYISQLHTQLGGMGAGFAKALSGLLCAPFGYDKTAKAVTNELLQHDIEFSPQYLPVVNSDSSLVILSPKGDKLAIGVREAMLHWHVTAHNKQLVNNAEIVVFCGAPNAFMAEVLAVCHPQTFIMCAPSFRNIIDPVVPFASLVPAIHYLTLNRQEWERLPDKDAYRHDIPIISVTDGPHGSVIYQPAKAIMKIPTQAVQGDIDSNRAGETYAAAFLKYLLHAGIPPVSQIRDGLPRQLVKRAALYATAQAVKQLSLTAFAFPADDLAEP